jgi:pimeloyl-ACP methyl ester carboxylesterase
MPHNDQLHRSLFLIAGLLFSFGLSTPASAQEPDPYAGGKALVADLDKIVAPHGVDDTFVATLGGTRQVVNVRGADRDNPILLFIHGGPAAPEMPIAWAFQRPWEDFFTVVQWDQRGSGRSFELNEPGKIAPTLNVDRYRDDAIELIELLQKRYGKHKVFVLGHSWGSIVGLSVAIKRPDLLYAYIGIGQVIDFRRNEQLGFERTLEAARQSKNAVAVRELEAIRPYPGAGPFDIDKVAVDRKWSDYFGGLAAGRTNGDFYFHLGRLSPLYTPADRKAWDAGSAFTIKTLLPQLSSVNFSNVHKLDVPVLMLLGKHDTTTPPGIAAEWMNRLKAPSKRVVWFKNSAHLPFIEEPGRTLEALVRFALPLAGEADSAPKQD